MFELFYRTKKGEKWQFVFDVIYCLLAFFLSYFFLLFFVEREVCI